MRTPTEILAQTQTIALVGASPRPERPSNGVMRYLLAQGYKVIPVRPHRTEILGIPCPDVAEQAAAAGAKALWLQLGIVSPKAQGIAERAGMDYVENACTAVVHSLYLAGSKPD